MAAHLDFDLRFRADPWPRRRERTDETTRILVLGDFSGGEGRGTREPPPLAERRIFPIDVDCFDQVMERLSPRATVCDGTDEPPVELVFRGIEDFHPDALFRRVPRLARLHALRERLVTPSSFADAASELSSLVQDLPSPAPAALHEPTATAAEEDEKTLERLLGRKPTTSPGTATPSVVADVVRRIAAEASRGTAAPGAVASLPAYLAAIDDLAATRLRSILHTPSFRRLEASWRSLRALVSGVETGEGLSIHVLDATRAELSADVVASEGDLSTTGLWQHLVGHGPDGEGGRPWWLIVGDFSFGPDANDLSLLHALGALASRAGGPFLAEATPAVLGCTRRQDLADPARWPAPGDAWQELRESSAAPWLGLALPRVLLRLPYGPRREEIESFSFDEVGGAPEPGDLLWGNPAFLCALLSARAAQEGAYAAPLEAGDLPALVYDEEGEKKLSPCAEEWIGERAGLAMLERGVIPLLSRRDRNSVRLLRLQSLSDPPQDLLRLQ